MKARECGLGVRVDSGAPYVHLVDLKKVQAAASPPVVDQAKRTAAALWKAATEAKAKPSG